MRIRFVDMIKALKNLLILFFLIFASRDLLAQNTPLNFVGELPKKLNESSALVYTDVGIFSLSDDTQPEIFNIDPKTGDILQTISIGGISFIDKEALTADDKYLYIGDFGNNNGDRKDLKIVRLKLSKITNVENQNVTGEIISFHYPEQKSFNLKKKENAFDAEALVTFGGKLYLFTKQRNDHQTTLYEIPATPGNYAAKKIGVFNVNGRITDAALSPDSKTLLLLGYQADHLYSFLWKFEEFEGRNFFSGNADYKIIALETIDWQTEGLTFINESDFLLSCETTETIQASLYHGNTTTLFR